jgi:dephospho-CoA kinase
MVALLRSDVPCPTWSEGLIELLSCLFLYLPLSIVLGQVYIRVAATISIPKTMKRLRQTVPVAIWNFVIQCILADLVLAGLLWSVASRCGETMTPKGTRWAGWNVDWGYNGPFLVFLLRLFMTCLGISIGEKFFPLALTGGIACGKSTVSELLRQKKNKYDDNDYFCLLDADKIGHQILLPPWHVDLNQPDSIVRPSDSVYDQILKAFGETPSPTTIDGRKEGDDHLASSSSLLNDEKLIDRNKLGRRVFANPQDRRTLNSITHRRIFGTLVKHLAYQIYWGNGGHGDKSTKYRWVCAEIPLLFESGPLRYIFGLSIVVACHPEQQLKRLQARNPELKPEECQARIDSQIPISEKVKLGDIVILNEVDIAESEKNMEALVKQVDRACRQMRQRVYGIMGTSLYQMILLLSISLVLSVSFQLLDVFGS